MTVIQTGAIAAVAFVFGEYASEIYRLGEQSTAIYAALSVVALTLLSGMSDPELMRWLANEALAKAKEVGYAP